MTTQLPARPESYFLTHRCNGWDAAWAALRRWIRESYQRDTDLADVSPMGERWQYLGTWKSDAGWQHCFRHRDYRTSPKQNLGVRVYARIPAPPASVETPEGWDSIDTSTE